MRWRNFQDNLRQLRRLDIADRHLRFYQRNSPFVSGPTRLNV